MSQVTLRSSGSNPPPGSNAVAFSAQQLGDTPDLSVAFDPAVGSYILGTEAILTKLFDTNNALFPGDGISLPATFTAPYSGYYYLSMTVFVVNRSEVFFENYNFQINTPAINYMGGYVFDAENPTYLTYSVVAHLAVTDVVTFQVNVEGQANGAPPFFMYGVNGGTTAQTSVSGFLIN